ncbi:hypothetical protein [Pelagerythrobacter rhizovicinus]|uniref:Uncharacterized protein n=1 Tax=Pelagerythrobacter rhizovicinus TaxID=2268576 RepID=A0A4Q2KSK8_9SPHN|nr:hypothetical protein [Pelagerythrobacter rhizovicinus]RXZ66331.1 hypothetical protein ETX26_06440 [Pelagerythrobacter rhizovicinus]
MNKLQRTNTRTPADASKILGWGVDADPQNDPTYPLRDRSKEDGLSVDWKRPQQQDSGMEILQSIEFAHTPAVYGTSVPPSGVSGMIRRAAFRWSESNWLHWLLLMGADRVNVVEGIAQDLARGRLLNIPAEMGARSEWQHNKKGFATKAVVVAALGAGVVTLLRWRRAR